MGEFGFTSGLKMPDGSRLKPYAASIAEMIVYLYAFANDYSGAYLWMLSEWPVANMRYNADWISQDRYIYESRFGMYYYDGTPTGKPKPIAHATKFFRRYIDTHQTGQGDFKLTKAKTPMGAGYLFTDKDALFVGDTVYKSERIKFNSTKPVNVMLQWNEKKLDIMATADVKVQLNLSKFDFPDTSEFRKPRICAKCTINKNIMELDLLEGQIVTIYAKK
jgi:hypothetical protein